MSILGYDKKSKLLKGRDQVSMVFLKEKVNTSTNSDNATWKHVGTFLKGCMINKSFKNLHEQFLNVK